MQLPHVAGWLGALLVAGLGPSATPAEAPESSGVQRAAASCVAEGGTGAVQAPKLVRQIPTGETGWFSSPSLVDLDGDGRLEIVAPFYSTFVFDANGQRAGQGPVEQGPGLRPVGGHRPRGRRRQGHRGRRQRGHRGGVRVPRRAAAAQAGLAGVHQQWRPVPGGPRARRRRPGRRRPGRGRGDDDQHRLQGRPGLRLRRERPAVPAGRSTPTPGPATAATAPTARTSASATSTTTRSWRSSPPSTTTRSTPSTSTAPRSSPRPGSPTPSRAPRASGWPGATSSGGPARRSSGATTTCTRARGRARPASPGCSGPPHRRRSPTWTATATTR